MRLRISELPAAAGLATRQVGNGLSGHATPNIGNPFSILPSTFSVLWEIINDKDYREMFVDKQKLSVLPHVKSTFRDNQRRCPRSILPPVRNRGKMDKRAPVVWKENTACFSLSQLVAS